MDIFSKNVNVMNMLPGPMQSRCLEGLKREDFSKQTIKNRFQKRKAFGDGFWMVLGSVLGGFWEPNSNKKGCGKWMKNWMRFWRLLGGFLAESGGGWRQGGGPWDLQELGQELGPRKFRARRAPCPWQGAADP